MTQKIRWGVVGAGGIARRRMIPEGLLTARNAKLVAVWDRQPAVTAEVAAQFGVRAAGSLEALLQDDLDAIYMATPPAAHLAQTLACARAGRHVLCEKPLGRTVAEASALVAACAEAGVCLGIGLMMRFHAQHEAARQLIQAGRLGRLVFGRAQLSCWYPPMAGAWRQHPEQSGGGALMDLGGHCLDLLEMFLGTATAVSCITRRTVHDYPVEDSAVVTLEFASGALGVVDAFFCVPDASSRNVLELYGSKGSILAQNTIGQNERGTMVAHLDGEERDYDAQQTRTAAGDTLIDPEPINMYRAEIEAFSQALLEGREPANHARIGLQSQRLIEACYESARQGRRVSLEPLPPASHSTLS